MEKYKNKLYKILPLYEGKIKGEEIYLPEDVAFDEYTHYINMLIIEFSGFDEEPYDEILHYLKGLKSVGKNVTHEQVRKIVFHCIGLLKG